MGRHSAPESDAPPAAQDPGPTGTSAPRRSPGRRIVGLVASLLVVAVVALALAVTVLPAAVGGQVYVVRSGSMRPTLEVGSVAVVRPAAVESLRAGEVIAFTERAPTGGVRTVVHRVIAVEPGPVFRTQGDANADPDLAPADATSVTGRLWFDIPYVGTVADFVRTGPGMIVAGGVLLLAVAVMVLTPGGRRRDA